MEFLKALVQDFAELNPIQTEQLLLEVLDAEHMTVDQFAEDILLAYRDPRGRPAAECFLSIISKCKGTELYRKAYIPYLKATGQFLKVCN